jgi:hypothetical protein
VEWIRLERLFSNPRWQIEIVAGVYLIRAGA